MTRPDIHRDPAELHAAAQALRRVLDELAPLLTATASVPASEASEAAHEQVRVAVGNAVAELELLEAGARRAAGAATADLDGLRALRGVDGR